MPQEATHTHDLRRVSVIFGTLPLGEFGGWGEGGNAIKIEKEKDSFVSVEGADGTIVRSPTYSRLYKVTLSLLQTAFMNSVLSGLLLLDTTKPNGAAVLPILIKTQDGLDVFSGNEAWIMGHPKTVEYAQQVKNVEWMIQVADGNLFLGGYI